MSRIVPGIITAPNTCYPCQVGSTGPMGPSGPQGPQGPDVVNFGNSVHVDAIYGDDCTAQVESFVLPFKCLPAAACAAAELAASRCETTVTVYVRPGIYHVDGNIARDKVNWYFEEGAVVKVCNGPLFDDCSLCTGFDIQGYGVFESVDSTGLFKLGHVCEAIYNFEGKSATVCYREHREVVLLDIEKQRATYNFKFDSMEIKSECSACRTCGLTAVALIKSDNVSMDVDTIKVQLPNVTNTAGSIYAVKVALCGFERVKPIDIKSREISLEVGYYNSCETDTELKAIDVKVDGDPEGIISISADKLKAKTNDISTRVISNFGVACIVGCGHCLNVNIQTDLIELEGNNNPLNAISYAIYLSALKLNLEALTFEVEYYSNQGSLYIIDALNGSELTGTLEDIKAVVSSNNYGGYTGFNVDCETHVDLKLHDMRLNVGVASTPLAALNSGVVTGIISNGMLKLDLNLLEINIWGDTVNNVNSQNTGGISLAELNGTSKIFANEFHLYANDNPFSGSTGPFSTGLIIGIGMGSNAEADLDINLINIELTPTGTVSNVITGGTLFGILYSGLTNIKSNKISLTVNGNNQNSGTVYLLFGPDANTETNMLVNDMSLSLTGTNYGTLAMGNLNGLIYIDVEINETINATGCEGTTKGFIVFENASAQIVANAIVANGVGQFFDGCATNCDLKVNVNYIAISNSLAVEGTLMVGNGANIDFYATDLKTNGGNLFKLNGGLPTIEVKTLYGPLTTGYLFKLGCTETHIKINNLQVAGDSGTNYFEVCDGYHYLDLDYVDCCNAQFNSILNMSGGKVYANMKKISGGVSHIGQLMNVTGGYLELKSDEINPKLGHECEAIPLFVFNDNH
jgi:hypothetical protein